MSAPTTMSNHVSPPLTSPSIARAPISYAWLHLRDAAFACSRAALDAGRNREALAWNTIAVEADGKAVRS